MTASETWLGPAAFRPASETDCAPRAGFPLSGIAFFSQPTLTFNSQNHTMSEIYAAVLHGAKDLRLVSSLFSPGRRRRADVPPLSSKTKRPISPPAAGEAQVAIKATGLCGSDCSSLLSFLPLVVGEAWGKRGGGRRRC